ncbi:ferritin-like domain-containing protein [Noviherbaspirillum sp.]|uniref:ferritin-like domain-containing protein n=1 Tax=Noviherbaspirillum sp. TaxID=1926288 RepID=UPI002FE0A84F
MNNDEVISTLNDLIETCKDGEEGFRTCADDLKDTQIKSLFMNRAQGCAQAAGELQQLVRTYGGDPETSSGLGGALHRRWVDLKSLVTGKDDKSILNECERGEDVAVRSYRTALEKNLPVDVRNIVERQYQGVLQNHDQVKRLREQFKNA